MPRAVGRTAIAQTPLLAAHGGQPVSELLAGERFDVLELSHGYAWGVGAVDGAVGFVAMEALGAPVDVTHIVCAVGAALPMGTQLTADEGGEHSTPAAIRPLDAPRPRTIVALAEALVGTPVVAGGRSSVGRRCRRARVACSVDRRDPGAALRRSPGRRRSGHAVVRERADAARRPAVLRATASRSPPTTRRDPV